MHTRDAGVRSLLLIVAAVTMFPLYNWLQKLDFRLAKPMLLVRPLAMEKSSIVTSNGSMTSAATTPLAMEKPLVVTSSMTSAATPTEKKPLLVFITAVNRPNNLPLLLTRILPIRKCFDVRWLLVFSAARSKPWSERKYFAHNLLQWITQLRTQDTNSNAGHKHNVALDFIGNTSQLRDGNGFIYILDDDNFPPFGLCNAPMDTDAVYFGNQMTYKRGRMVVRILTLIPSAEMFSFQREEDVSLRLVNHIDSGSLLLPLSLWRRLGVHTIRHKPVYNHDGWFFSEIVAKSMGSALQFRRLADSVQLFYNGINSVWSSWYGKEQSTKSLKAFRGIVGQMLDFQRTHPELFKMARKEVSAPFICLPVEITMNRD